ncbi:extracellular catalytic domain type 1 short-chain-length polyhydroxyalkanoate depolymerase [Roseomonas xinghualingensis]|uniref:extracellular catalytic domain type 1 short-chain-length polyhydroxyalkanoate depolymerase n=1 Tax=Roseomonas xinghualingensis TaxID=2986475 RepID=UPI0021F19A7E|nr:PHB depolymerase family esterase [Roseomonas sp. SXEYE001]MCV4207192.1 PHB depolymerase family esterase [Roseomonas sp. SXEYE001]
MARQPSGDGRLSEVVGFGTNPGGLRMLTYLPPDLPQGAPLVVALHGCTQTAAGYDLGCGWSDMAERSGFALLLPEQRRANNAHLCFNWFEPGDTARDAGEALSIRQMVDYLTRTHGLDPAQVFITGLSAGGAMTSVMLATYPEVFAAGAVVAGLPYGAARGVGEAFSAMGRPAALPLAARGDAVRAASPHSGPWPRVAVWHGEADATVHPDNADEIVKQWLDLHQIGNRPPSQELRSAVHHQRHWLGADGRAWVECHRIADMAHGVPIHPGEAEGRCGVAGPYLLDVGVSSTHHILDFWGLESAGVALHAEAPREAPAASRDPQRPAYVETGWAGVQMERGPGAAIAQALRAAGLMGR